MTKSGSKIELYALVVGSCRYAEKICIDIKRDSYMYSYIANQIEIKHNYFYLLE